MAKSSQKSSAVSYGSYSLIMMMFLWYFFKDNAHLLVKFTNPVLATVSQRALMLSHLVKQLPVPILDVNVAMVKCLTQCRKNVFQQKIVV